MGRPSSIRRGVRSSTHDWNPANNSASTTFVVGGLDIKKGVSQSSAAAGEIFTFAITVTNSSDSSVGASVKDVISSTLDVANCTLQRFSGSTLVFQTNCYFSGRTLNSYISIPASQIALYTIAVRGNKDVGETSKVATNQASVSWGNPAFTIYSNVVSIELTPGGFLQVGKSDGLDTVYKGQSISYTISITNTGSIPVTLDRITDTFVSNVSFVSINKNGLTMNDVATTGNIRAWSFPSKVLNSGEKITFLIGAKTSSNPSSPLISINQATASGIDNNGRLLTNNNGANTAIDQNTIQETTSSSIRFVKSVSPQQAKVGETFTFKIDVENRGTVTLSNVRMSDVFPTQVDLTSATTSRGVAKLNTSTREVEITIPTLASGEGATIVIQVKVNTSVATPKTLRNRGELNWNGGATYLSNAVAYRVLPSGSLPGTGLQPVAASAAWTSGPSQVLAVLGIILALLGVLILIYSFWARSRRPLYAGRYSRNALVLLFIRCHPWNRRLADPPGCRGVQPDGYARW